MSVYMASQRRVQSPQLSPNLTVHCLSTPPTDGLTSSHVVMYGTLTDIAALAQKAPAWTFPRSVPILGDDGTWDTKKFMAADFRGHLTLSIEAQQMHSFSSLVKKQSFMQGVEIGLVDITNSAFNRERGRAILNLGDFEELRSLDYKRAQQENEMILAGKMVIRHDFDDDQIHMEIHMRKIKSRDFLDWPKMVQDAYIKHADEHAMKLIPPVTADPNDPNAGRQESQGDATETATPTPAEALA